MVQPRDKTLPTHPIVPGKLVRKYGLSGARLRQIIFLSGLSLAMASVCWLPAIFEANESLGNRIGVSAIGLFMSLPFFFGIYRLTRLGGVSLQQFEGGLVYRQRGRITATTWDEIDSYQDLGRIIKSDGQVIEFSAIENIEEAADAICAETLQRMLPKAKAAINDGLSVLFKGEKPIGKALNQYASISSGFSVDAQGITWLDGGSKIAWGAVTDYGLGQAAMGRLEVDVFFVTDGQARYQTRYELLHNAHVLMAICDELTGLDPQG
jgi:hypothetical protein